MDDSENSPYTVLIIFAVILLYLLFAIILRPTSRVMRAMPNRIRFWFLPPIMHEYLPYLIHNFPFYTRLNDKARRVFEGRVQKFIDEKEFIPRGGYPEVTAEMKALIAGTAIQLTFGYPNIYFRYFEKILVYPDDYYSTITRQYHKGEVNRGGIIVLSWRNLKEGFRDLSDGIHLGLHEMAHALRLINLVDNEEYDFYDREMMRSFDTEASSEIRRMDADDNPGLFRQYAATNTDEFFAVSVEVFFEQPDAFFTYHPRLYAMMAAILKMDLRSGSLQPFRLTPP